MRVLERECLKGLVIGSDLYFEGLKFAFQRVSCSLLQADAYNLPFAPNLNLVCMFDVLEHFPDDEGFLVYLYSMLARGGVLFLTVPAHPSLWSYFDEASHHKRRYLPNELNKKLLKAGFRVDYQTQYMAGIFPLVWFGRKLSGLVRSWQDNNKDKHVYMTKQEFTIVPVVNGMLTGLLSLELRLIKNRRKLPFGSSLLALARKI